MSDRVSQAEIEDVLSSIRRLVSDDAGQGRSAEDENVADVAAVQPVAPPKLVLTEALRVSDPVPVPPEVVDDPALIETETTINAETPDTELLGDGEDAAVDGSEVEPSDEIDADAPWHRPGARLFDVVTEEEERQPAQVLNPEPELVQADDISPDDVAKERISAVVRKISELEVKVARSPEDWEPEGRVEHPFAGVEPLSPLNWDEAAEEPPFTEALEVAEADPADTRSQDAEPHTQSDEVQSELGEISEEQPEHPGLMSGSSADAALEAALIADDDTILDEESLRELVSDIVREELQGALGERITRNVRKLVRREIHRALEARDLS